MGCFQGEYAKIAEKAKITTAPVIAKKIYMYIKKLHQTHVHAYWIYIGKKGLDPSSQRSMLRLANTEKQLREI